MQIESDYSDEEDEFQRPTDMTVEEEIEAIWIWIRILTNQLFEPDEEILVHE